MNEQVKPSIKDKIFLLGDYIDRGPGSKDVLDFIFELQKNGNRIYPIRGNHEQFLLDANNDFSEYEHWVEYNGGNTTLSSFGAKKVNDIPHHYLNFMKSLPFYIELEDFYLVHAGFNFLSPAPFEDKMAMLYIRDYPVDRKMLGGRKIIHGHTPTQLERIKENLVDQGSPTINLDAGCVYQRYPGLGNLLALELNSWELYVQPCLDDVAWRPI